jgi:hypothetical protein
MRTANVFVSVFLARLSSVTVASDSEYPTPADAQEQIIHRACTFIHHGIELVAGGKYCAENGSQSAGSCMYMSDDPCGVRQGIERWRVDGKQDTENVAPQ